MYSCDSCDFYNVPKSAVKKKMCKDLYSVLGLYSIQYLCTCTCIIVVRLVVVMKRR